MNSSLLGEEHIEFLEQQFLNFKKPQPKKIKVDFHLEDAKNIAIPSRKHSFKELEDYNDTNYLDTEAEIPTSAIKPNNQRDKTSHKFKPFIKPSDLKCKKLLKTRQEIQQMKLQSERKCQELESSTDQE